MSKLLGQNEWIVRYLCSWFGDGWDNGDLTSTDEVLDRELEGLQLDVLLTLREGLGRLVPLLIRMDTQEAALEMAKLGIFFRGPSEKRDAHEWIDVLQQRIEAEWLSRKQ